MNRKGIAAMSETDNKPRNEVVTNAPGQPTHRSSQRPWLAVPPNIHVQSPNVWGYRGPLRLRDRGLTRRLLRRERRCHGRVVDCGVPGTRLRPRVRELVGLILSPNPRGSTFYPLRVSLSVMGGRNRILAAKALDE